MHFGLNRRMVGDRRKPQHMLIEQTASQPWWHGLFRRIQSTVADSASEMLRVTEEQVQLHDTLDQLEARVRRRNNA